MENNEIQISFAPIELCEYNEGQIPGLPANPRTREDNKQRSLEKSIAELPEMTIARAALCYEYNGKYVVIGGNRRLEAQRALNLKMIPIILLPAETPVEKLRRIALLDNESTGQTDWHKLAKEWNKDEIKSWAIETPKGWFNEVPEKKTAQEDDYTEPAKLKSKVKQGEVWQLGDHRLMCGDATNADDVAKLMNGDKADMVFTDPPYNVNYSAKNKFLNEADKGNRIQKDIENDSFRTDEEIGEKVWYPAFLNMFISAKSDCSFYVTMPQGGTHMMMMMMMNKSGWQVKHEIIWLKNNHVLSRTDYFYKHEPIMFGWKEKHNFYGKGEFNKSVWEIEKPLKNDLHPTMKPIRLISNALENSSKLNDIVIDFFGGSGSTLIACEQLNRKCRMMELDKHYCDVIINRWETLTGQKAKKIE